VRLQRNRGHLCSQKGTAILSRYGKGEHEPPIGANRNFGTFSERCGLPKEPTGSISTPGRVVRLVSRALVEIGVFLFIKMLFFDGLTTISASFDKAQSGNGVLLYYLEKFGRGSSSKRAPKCAIGIRYRPHR